MRNGLVNGPMYEMNVGYTGPLRAPPPPHLELGVHVRSVPTEAETEKLEAELLDDSLMQKNVGFHAEDGEKVTESGLWLGGSIPECMGKLLDSKKK